MVELVFSPEWFYGKDIFIDIFSIVIPVLIGLFCISYYRLSKNKDYIYLTSSFMLIAAAFLFKILTNITIYYDVFFTRTIGLVTYTFKTVKSSDALIIIGILLFRLLMILGFYVLYVTADKQNKDNTIKSWINQIFIIYLLAITVLLSQYNYLVFHITSLLLSMMITYKFYLVYRKNKSNTTGLIAISFGVIALSQLIFSFVKVNIGSYVIGEIVQLIGYVTLLVSFILVRKHGKKKKQDRYHK